MDPKLLIAVAVVTLVVMLLRGGGGGADPAEAKAAVQAGATLLDVRSEGEFRGGHIEGAKNIPHFALEGRVAELDRAQPVVVYCRSGARSAKAAGVLERAGFRVMDLGGMGRWPR